MNNSQKVQTFTKDHELRILGEGQFLGLEDALLKRSKHINSYFTQSCWSKSAITSVFYFDKEKCWEKLHYLRLMDNLTSLAKKDFKRLKNFNKQSLKISKRIQR